jgi:RNA polymerase sigma factor (sigma-70 family)
LTGSLKGFLLACTANHARNWNKAQRVRLRTAGADDDPARNVADEPLDALVCNEQLERLSGALAELPLEQREIVMLHLHGRMTFQAIAGAMRISTNTAKSRYRYGMDKLRVTLNGEVTECNQQTT